MASVSGSVVTLINATFSNSFYGLPGGLLDSNKIYWYRRTDSSQFICQLQVITGKNIEGAQTFDVPPNSSVGLWYDGTTYSFISYSSF